MPEQQIGSVTRFSPRASLAAIGLKMKVIPGCAVTKLSNVPSAAQVAPNLPSFKTRSTPALKRTFLK
jgi:hypothetical protein